MTPTPSTPSRWSVVRRIMTNAKYLFQIAAVLLAFIALVAVGRAIYRWWSPATTIVTQLTPIIKTIEVPVDKIVTRTVRTYVRTEDQTMINTLLAQNESLRAEVNRLTIAYASSTSTGVASQVESSTPTSTAPASENPFPFQYRDWRLAATVTSRESLSYTLSQRFALAVTSGVTDKNVPVSTAVLYEIGPNETRTPLTITDTQFIVAGQPKRHWYRDMSLQGGLAKTSPTWEGVVALQWLKRGSHKSAEHSQWAVLTPAVSFTRTTTTVGVLPVSANLGQIPGVQSVVKDVWISPMLTRTSRGIAVTVTF